MLNVAELPKDPIEACKVALTRMAAATRAGGARLDQLREGNHPVYNEIFILRMVVAKSVTRLENSEVQDLVRRNLEFAQGETLPSLNAKVELALQAIIAHELDAHFIDDEMESEFDHANLTNDEKAEIRALMAETRQLVDRSDTLPSWARRNVLYHVSKIENELHREQSRYQAFLAAAAQMSGLVKKVGEDAEPIAKRIQEARTITERKVDGLAQIEADEAPKRLPSPKVESVD